MLTWLLNWLHNRSREQSRAIFRFWDGKRTRSVDPMKVWCLLLDDPAYLMDKHNVLIDAGDLEAQGIAIAAVRRAFGVTAYEQGKGGLTHTETLSLLLAFFLYLEELKKSTDPTPISPPPTASASSAVQSITNAPLDCGVTPNALNSASLPV